MNGPMVQLQHHVGIGIVRTTTQIVNTAISGYLNDVGATAIQTWSSSWGHPTGRAEAKAAEVSWDMPELLRVGWNQQAMFDYERVSNSNDLENLEQSFTPMTSQHFFQGNLGTHSQGAYAWFGGSFLGLLVLFFQTLFKNVFSPMKHGKSQSTWRSLKFEIVAILRLSLK